MGKKKKENRIPLREEYRVDCPNSTAVNLVRLFVGEERGRPYAKVYFHKVEDEPLVLSESPPFDDDCSPIIVKEKAVKWIRENLDTEAKITLEMKSGS